MREDMQKGKRLIYVDIVKGVAITAVVLLHVDYAFHNSTFLPLWSLLGNSWHVCVFFMVSGFFLKNESLLHTRPFLQRKAHLLYLPLICYYLVFLLLHNAFIHIGFYEVGMEYGGKVMAPFGIADFLRHFAASLVLAGREPLLAPLWFVSVMIIAFVLMWGVSKVLSLFLGRWQHDVNSKAFEYTRMCVILLACIIMHLLSNVFHFNIPRFNNSFTALWLILCGYFVFQKMKMKFDSMKVAVACAVAVYVCNIVFGANVLMTNSYHNIVSLTICTFSALYVICFVAKKVQTTLLGRLMAWVGNHSYAIMALHLLAFKIATVMLRLTLFPKQPLSPLNPVAGNSLWLLLYFTFIGVILPALLASIYAWLCRRLSGNT